MLIVFPYYFNFWLKNVLKYWTLFYLYSSCTEYICKPIKNLFDFNYVIDIYCLYKFAYRINFYFFLKKRSL